MTKNVIFIAVPRTGCNSVWYGCLSKHPDSAQGRPWGMNIPDFQGKRIISIGHMSLAALLKEGIIKKDFYDNAFKFSFVRNPWDRLVSLYFYYKREMKKGLNHSAFPLIVKNDLISRLFRKMPNFQDKAMISFKSFCRYLYDNKIAPLGIYNTKGLSQANNQVDWLVDEKGDFVTDFVGKFENFENDFAMACEKAGLGGMKLPKMNASEHHQYRHYYDKETMKLVGEIYGKDISAFGYEF